MIKDLHNLKLEAKRKALESLARYKFMMFGYHAALWVSLNSIDTEKEHNPFKPIVDNARQLLGGFF